MASMVPVDSDLIESLGYEGRTLYVRFKGGRTYKYSGVPPGTYEEMKQAKSVGSYFRKNVSGKFKQV